MWYFDICWSRCTSNSRRTYTTTTSTQVTHCRRRCVITYKNPGQCRSCPQWTTVRSYSLHFFHDPIKKESIAQLFVGQRLSVKRWHLNTQCTKQNQTRNWQDKRRRPWKHLNQIRSRLKLHYKCTLSRLHVRLNLLLFQNTRWQWLDPAKKGIMICTPFSTWFLLP